MILRLKGRRRGRKKLTPEIKEDLAENASVFKIGVYL